jgi:transcriptional regulator with XRE-family HTH domain
MQGSLARKLRVLRAERGLTLRQAAEQAGVRPGTLSELERGLHRPHDITLSRVAKGYGVPVEDLLEEPVPFDEAPQEPGRAVVGVGTTPEEATENLEQQLYSPAKIAQGWYQLAQLFSDELEKVEKGDSEAGSLEILIDTLEHVVLGMEANVASEKKELKARYEDEDTIRSKAVLSPAMVRLAVVVEEVLQKIAREQLEVKAESADKLVRLENRFKMAS